MSDTDRDESRPAAPGDIPDEDRGRKRPRNAAGCKASVCKNKRNLGQEYVSRSTRKVTKKREIGNPCRDGCFAKLGIQVIKDIFTGFWEMGDFNMQNCYLQNLCETLPVKRKRTKQAVSRRSLSRRFSVVHNNVTTKVCRGAFVAIHGLSIKRVVNAITKLTHTSTPLLDRRGRHEPANKIKDHSLQQYSVQISASHHNGVLEKAGLHNCLEMNRENAMCVARTGGEPSTSE
ncbi:hypothetical protein GWK47_025017 [Chionoecetes opilio]|uniref:Uncharacterized protein n=1 Tax=Chionoecetes opilio TaxID=41210 RepID=A0A8J4XLW2_CHIOP|nr:hypothetical protein GWK47_025017 [Chionoecetes opilio]